MIIASRLAECRAKGPALFRPRAVRRQHRLRIAAKRLRYALDLFVPCWGRELHELAHEVARLQTSLGALHDCDEWITDLRARLEQQYDETSTAADTADASVETVRHAAYWLLSKLIAKRAHHLRDALERWESWESTDFFARIAAALDSLPAPSEPMQTMPAPPDADGS